MDGADDKIKLFKFIQKIYQFIGIFPNQSNENCSRFNSKIWFFIFSLAITFILALAYFFIEANFMIEYGMSFYMSTTVILSIFLYLNLVWKMGNISNYIENCEKFIEKRIQSTILYKNAIEKIERLTKLLAYALFVTLIIFVLPSALYSIFNYFILNLGKESFSLFFPFWFPFDWKTPFGYLLAWILHSTGITAVITTGVLFFGMIFGSSWLFIVIVEDITSDVTVFNDTVETQKDREEDNENDCMELIDRFFNVIQFYSDAKECVNGFNKVYKFSIFLVLLWNLLAISSLLVSLQFQLWNHYSKLFEITILLILISWIFFLNFVTCESGQRVTDRFDEFAVKFAQCEWYELPIKMQRLYLIFLLDTQQPKNLQSCYGGIICTRETFKRILTKGFSYFMTIRNFRA